MICAVISKIISVLKNSPILNIQVHTWDSCECNYTLKKKINTLFDIVIPLQEFVAVLKVFLQNPKSSFIAWKSMFFDPPTSRSQRKKSVHTVNTRRNCVYTKDV